MSTKSGFICWRLFLVLLAGGATVSTGLLLWTSWIQHEQPLITDILRCHIPQLDPFDKSVIDIYRKHDRLRCTGKPSLTYGDGGTVRLNKTAVKSKFGNTSIFCHYQEFIRGSTNPENTYAFTGPSVTFHADINVSAEFIKVECFNSVNNKSIYINFHATIVPKVGVEKRCDANLKRHKELSKPKELLNVLMIGIDSISRANFLRHMPITRKYLLENLTAIEMRGYTKLGDNTFPCVVPLITGKFPHELPWNESMRDIPFDKYNFIWNNFSSSGYRTLYVEDSPYGQIFHYHKSGFRVSPADHCNRAFAIALEKESSKWNNNYQCFEDRLEADILLRYVHDFTSTYREKPHFGFAFLTRLTHDDINMAGAADDPYFRFLQQMHSEGLLNNTVMLVYSDHGIRFGRIRQTYVGKLEERLPMLLLVFPKWFQVKYPNLMKNVKINSKRLITLFDVHETLKDILHFTGQIRTYSDIPRGISLFSEVPEDRTCAMAGILEHWCVCLERKRIQTTSAEATISADVIVKYINDRLSSHRDKCAVLRLHKIVDALSLIANDEILRFRKMHSDSLGSSIDYGQRTGADVAFTVTVMVMPGSGLFEGTVVFQEGTKQYKVSSDLSRINRYGKQSECIDMATLKKFCFCR